MGNNTSLEVLQTSLMDNDCLHSNLYRVFAGQTTKATFKILSREKPPHKGTFLTEIVHCQLTPDHTVKLLCKYAPEGNMRYQQLAYEGRVYQEIMNTIPLTSVHCYSTFSFHENGTAGSWLALDYLQDGKPIIELAPGAFEKAAVWIAEFHRLCEFKTYPFLKKYDEAYYLHRVSRAETLTASLPARFHWLKELLAYFREHIPFLLASPQTIIHGEYYGKNVLMKDDAIYPIDWETAAFAFGEMDVAAMTDGMDPERAGLAIEGYKKARWPNQAPLSDFEKRLLLARMFYPLHWVDDWQLDAGQFEQWMNSGKFGGKLLALLNQANRHP